MRELSTDLRLCGSPPALGRFVCFLVMPFRMGDRRESSITLPAKKGGSLKTLGHDAKGRPPKRAPLGNSNRETPWLAGNTCLTPKPAPPQQGYQQGAVAAQRDTGAAPVLR
jgi:hypothetical protein